MHFTIAKRNVVRTIKMLPQVNVSRIIKHCIRYLYLISYHLPVMVPHQLLYESEDVVSLASATHGILFSMPLSLNSQLSNFVISSTAVCLLSVATNEYDLCAFQTPPQWPFNENIWLQKRRMVWMCCEMLLLLVETLACPDIVLAISEDMTRTIYWWSTSVLAIWNNKNGRKQGHIIPAISYQLILSVF